MADLVKHMSRMQTELTKKYTEGYESTVKAVGNMKD